jgi:hypothetical protein
MDAPLEEGSSHQVCKIPLTYIRFLCCPAPPIFLFLYGISDSSALQRSEAPSTPIGGRTVFVSPPNAPPNALSNTTSNTPFTAAPTVPRWMKHFKAIKKNPKDEEVRPDGFIQRERVGAINQPLIAIETTAGNKACRAATEKQWDTIVKKAKSRNKVPDVLKAAEFYHFGNVSRNQKAKKPADTYIFLRRQSEADANTDLPVPLEDYAAERRRNIRGRRRSSLLDLGSDNSELQPIVSDATGTERYHMEPSGAHADTQDLPGNSNGRALEV